MKLNMDLVRKILIITEDETDFFNYYKYEESLNDIRLKKYTHDEIIYHIYQCNRAELIDATFDDMCEIVKITDLTPKGHEFLNNTRQDNIWNTVKKIGLKIGASSLSAFIQISSNVASEMIKTYFSTNGIIPIP